jgi:hypothetical protein
MMLSTSHVPRVAAVAAPSYHGHVARIPYHQAADFVEAVVFPRPMNDSLISSSRGKTDHNVRRNNQYKAVSSRRSGKSHGGASHFSKNQNRGHKQQTTARRRKQQKGNEHHGNNNSLQHPNQFMPGYGHYPQDSTFTPIYHQNQNFPLSPLPSSHKPPRTQRMSYISTNPTFNDDSPVPEYSHSFTCSNEIGEEGTRGTIVDVNQLSTSDRSSCFDKNMAELRVMYKKFAEKYRSRSLNNNTDLD